MRCYPSLGDPDPGLTEGIRARRAALSHAATDFITPIAPAQQWGGLAWIGNITPPSTFSHHVHVDSIATTAASLHVRGPPYSADAEFSVLSSDGRHPFGNVVRVGEHCRAVRTSARRQRELGALAVWFMVGDEPGVLVRGRDLRCHVLC
jgi:hypothetical protein